MDFMITRTYVPMNEKMEAIMRILSASLDNTTGTYKVGSIAVFELYEIAKLYTNIELPEEPIEAYDMLAENGFDMCLYGEADVDVKRFKKLLYKQIEKLEYYQTSIYGILDSIKNDYNNLNLDVDEIRNKLANAEGIETVKAVVEKLG